MQIDEAEAKRLKIWMRKRKLGGSDSEDSSNDEEEEGNEKSVVLNNGGFSVCLSKDTEGSLNSITGGKQDGVFSGRASCESGSEEENEVACGEVAMNGETEVGVAEPEVREDLAEVQSGATSCTTDLEVSEVEVVQAEKQENVGNVAESPLVAGDINGELNLDEFNSAAELEVLGMDRLKTELQAHGLKCGGTLVECAARLFLLKSTPVEKLPKKLLAKK